MEKQSGTMAMVSHKFTSGNLHSKIEQAYNEVRVLEPLISSDLKEVSKNVGAPLEGLAFSVKTADSIEDKLFRAKGEAKEIAPDAKFVMENKFNRLKDLIRYTEICDFDNAVSTVKDTISSLEERGYTLSEVKNYYAKPVKESGYKGLHLNFISPYGQEIEVQLHTKEGFDAKQREHVLYELFREPAANEKTKNELSIKMKEILSSVKNPEGIESIEWYTMPEKEKEALKIKRQNDVLVQYDARLSPETESEAVYFAVYYKDKPILEGYENQYDKGSVKHYHVDRRKEKPEAIICSVSRNGTLISVNPSKDRVLTMDKIMYIADETMRRHDKLMAEYRPALDKEDKEELMASLEHNTVDKASDSEKSVEISDEIEPSSLQLEEER